MPITAKHVLKTFWQAVRNYKVLLFSMLFGVSLATAMELVVPLYYKKFFDVLTSSQDLRSASAHELVNIILTILALHGLMWLFYRACTFLNSAFQARIMAVLRQTSFDYLLAHSYDFFSNNFVGSLVQKVNRLVRSFERIADRLVWNVFPLAIRITGVSIGLWLVKPQVTLIILLWAVIFITFNFFFSRWKIKYDIERAEVDSRVTGVLADDITNHNTIQIFTGHAEESGRFREVTEKQRRITRFSWNLDGVVDAGQALLMILVEFALFYVGIRYWQEGVFTVGTFVLVQTYLLGLVGQLWDFTRVIRDFYQSFADAKEMVEILNTPHAIKDAPQARELIVEKGEVKFENINFSFQDTRQVLRGLDFTVAAGEKVALVGPSGAGKSTIVKMLLRLYEPTSGTITIDGQNTMRITQESLRRHLGLVPQDPILFHRSLLENIRYGRREASDEEIYRVARLAHCEEFIKDLPKGYQTFVGERGIKLSGGERQRVAIARAMIKNAPILILDEATSSLDSHSEMLIQDALEKLMAGKTTIVIAHRLSTIRKMDRIIVLDNGHIIEEGTHGELVQKPHSLYQKLWTLQAGGFLPEEEDQEK